MEFEEAREIAKYVVPRLLFDLPTDVKIQLIKPGENGDSLLFRIVEKAASDILWKIAQLESQRGEKYV